MMGEKKRMGQAKTLRNSNLECLRILAMLCIMFHHFSVHGCAWVNKVYCADKYFVDATFSFGKLGVALFVMISGYFMVQSKFTVKKFWKIWGQTLFYSVAFCLYFAITKKQDVVGKDIFQSFFPLTFNQYWFVSAFVLLMLISPFLNQVLCSISKQNCQRLIAILLVVWGILPYVFKTGALAYTEFANLILFYLVAAYIRLHCDNTQRNASRHMIVGVLILALYLLWMGSGERTLLQTGDGTKLSTTFTYMQLNSAVMLFAAVEIFIGFLRMKPHSSRVVNLISGGTLGVYLIHDNNYVRPYLWYEVTKIGDFYNTGNFIWRSIVTVVAIFAVCTIIDLMRQATLERIWMGLGCIAGEKLHRPAMACWHKLRSGIVWVGVHYYGTSKKTATASKHQSSKKSTSREKQKTKTRV